MRGKPLFSVLVTIIVLALAVSAANAEISFLTTDGFWGRIDDGYDGVRLDVVGVIGTDPGTAWGSGSKTTANDTLIRLATVCTHDTTGDSTLAEWTGISPATYTNLGSHTYGPGACDYQGFFISEYIEGDGYGATDAIELYNNTGIDIDFTETPYFIQIFDGGSDIATTTITLTGSIAHGATYVVTSDNDTGVTAQLVTSVLSFTGDDAVALVTNHIDDTAEPDGATNNQWSSGPSTVSPTGTTNLNIDNEPIVQLFPTDDWNQVRYGYGTTGTGFAYQSGLAFRGTVTDQSEYGDQTPFLVGKLCHINNPITADNAFLSCPLTLDLYNVSCGATAIAPFPPTRLTFVYPVGLDETSNSGTIGDCAYPSTAVCADAVTVGQSTQTFHCFYPGDVVNVYTVSILGFMPVPPAQTCDGVTYNQEASTGIFISQEGASNCGCLFAMITESNPTAVELLSFGAAIAPEGVLLSWETATEVDNVGFNLYRAAAANGEKVKLNTDLIPTNVAPGSPFGALYEYLDKTALAGQTYFYWLEDIDTSNGSSLHGPVSVAVQ